MNIEGIPASCPFMKICTASRIVPRTRFTCESSSACASAASCETEKLQITEQGNMNLHILPYVCKMNNSTNFIITHVWKLKDLTEQATPNLILIRTLLEIVPRNEKELSKFRCMRFLRFTSIKIPSEAKRNKTGRLKVECVYINTWLSTKGNQ